MVGRSRAFTEEDCQSSKNGHLHITPETAPRRINSLAEMAGGRIHIGNIYRRHLSAQVKNACGRHRASARSIDTGKSKPIFPSLRAHEFSRPMRIKERQKTAGEIDEASQM